MARNKDPEIKALSTILEILSGLEPQTRDRIMQYIASWLDDQLGTPEDLGNFVPSDMVGQ